VGTLAEDGGACEVVVNAASKEYRLVEKVSVGNFHVLVAGSNEEASTVAARRDEQLVPEGAVSCSDPDITFGSCFVGTSVYSSGICYENLGKIDLTRKRIYVSAYGGSQVSVCPFYRFLVVK